MGAETAATAVQAAASDTVLWRARWRCCVLALLIIMYVSLLRFRTIDIFTKAGATHLSVSARLGVSSICIFLWLK